MTQGAMPPAATLLTYFAWNILVSDPDSFILSMCTRTRFYVQLSLLRQNDDATSFWRNNDVVITPIVRWIVAMASQFICLWKLTFVDLNLSIPSIYHPLYWLIPYLLECHWSLELGHTAYNACRLLDMWRNNLPNLAYCTWVISLKTQRSNNISRHLINPSKKNRRC